MSDHHQRGSRLRRLLGVGAFVLLGMELLYLLGANVFLNTSVGASAINRKPEKFHLEWQRAWTVVPGLVHLTDVQLRAQSRPVQWYLDAGQARIWLRLSRLGFKHLSARSTVLRDVDFRLRGRGIATSAETDCTLQPPIPGFGCGPDSAPALGPKPNKKWPWTFTFSGLQARDIHGLWLDRFRYEGHATAEGSFRFEIRGPFHMDTATARLAPGVLHVGDRQVTTQLQLDARAQFDSFMPRETNAREVLNYLSGRVELDSERSDLGFLTHLMRDTTWLDMGGEGRVHGTIDVDHGTLTTASRLDVDDAQVHIAFLDFTVAGAGGMRAQVVNDENDVWTEIAATVDRYTVGNGQTEPLVEGTDLTLLARSAEQDLSAPSSAIESTINVPPATIPDLRRLNVYWPSGSGFRLEKGSAQIGGHVSLSTNDPSGEGFVRFTAQEAEWSVADARLRGKVELRTHLTNANPVQRRFHLKNMRLDVTAEPVVVKQKAVAKQKGKAREAWHTEITVNDGKVRLIQPLEVDAAFKADVSDSRPLVAVLTARKPLLRWLRPLITMENIDLTGRLHLDGQAIHLAGMNLTSDGLDAKAHLTLAGKTPEGHVLVGLGRMTAAVELARGERDWKLIGARKWYAARVPDVEPP